MLQLPAQLTTAGRSRYPDAHSPTWTDSLRQDRPAEAFKRPTFDRPKATTTHSSFPTGKLVLVPDLSRGPRIPGLSS